MVTRSTLRRRIAISFTLSYICSVNFVYAINIYIYIYIYTYLFIYLSIYLFIHLLSYLFIYSVCVCVLCVYIRVCMYICLYVYSHITEESGIRPWPPLLCSCCITKWGRESEGGGLAHFCHSSCRGPARCHAKFLGTCEVPR